MIKCYKSVKLRWITLETSHIYNFTNFEYQALDFHRENKSNIMYMIDQRPPILNTKIINDPFIIFLKWYDIKITS